MKYIFANPKTETKWLSGYHILKKLAENAEVTDKTLFTSTRFGNQIATILEVLNITENEMEQLASFMGHTKKTHENFYRFPQDNYQTAKISKLLLLTNSGRASRYKGMSLEEMELSDSLESDNDSDKEREKGNRQRSEAEDERNLETTIGSISDDLDNDINDKENKINDKNKQKKN